MIPEGVNRSQVRVWYQDEARVGQRGTLTRIWAPKGKRPRLTRQQQFESAYLFGAICPEHSMAVGLVMPYANTEAMQQHLDEIAEYVAEDEFAVVVVDRAAWHTTAKLKVPQCMALLPLPPVSPELNPVEQVWSWLRQHFLANRSFEGYTAIVDACCEAWNNFASDADTIRSIGTRQWAKL